MSRVAHLAVIIAVTLAVSMPTATAAPTTPSDARSVVAGWLGADADPLGARLEQAVDAVETFTAEPGVPIFHVVSLKPQGFVIVSADDLIEPIIGFSASGTYDPSPSNPLVALVQNDLRQRAREARSGHLDGSPSVTWSATPGSEDPTPAQRKWRQLINPAAAFHADSPLTARWSEDIDDRRVDPLLDIEGIQWGQRTLSCGSACYNYFTPRVVNGAIRWDQGNADNWYCGCVTTAMVQLMRFHRYPVDPISPRMLEIRVVVDDETLEEQFVSRWLRGGSGIGGRYDWGLMVPRPDCRWQNEFERREIGALCFDAALATGARFLSNGTVAYMQNASQALVEVFQYENAVVGWCMDCDTLPGLINMINPNLDAAKPVLLSIKRYDENELKGHAVVCDGYGYSFRTLYHHLNLGWEQTVRAAFDVWYNLPDVNTPTHEYTVLRECVYNVFPEGRGEIISGRVLRTNGRPAAGVLVRARSADGAHEHEAATDARGIYALVGCEPDTEYLVWVEGMDSPGYDSQQRVWTGTSRDSCLVAGNRWAIDFPAVPPATDRQIIHVDCNAVGGLADGSSWSNAFTDLQEALAGLPPAFYGDETAEIWVADGTYTPGPATEAGRSQSFCLRDGVALYGGFAGWETQRDERDPQANPTILSGDLAGDDVHFRDIYRQATHVENSYHVVYSYGCGDERTAVLDGFTITAGNATSTDTQGRRHGGGIYICGGRPILRNCRFVDNAAFARGGAVYNSPGAAPLFVDCEFLANEVTDGWGGAVFNDDDSDPNFTGCTFSDNKALAYSGGAIYNNDDSTPNMVDGQFEANQARWGGAIYNDVGVVSRITRCRFSDNHAQGQTGGVLYNGLGSQVYLLNCEFLRNRAADGGVAFNQGCSLEAINCLFAENQAVAAPSYGGVMRNYGAEALCELRLINCTFIGNLASYGTTMICDSGSGGFGSDVRFANCILADQGTKVRTYDGSPIAIRYSAVLGGVSLSVSPGASLVWGAGNISSDPLVYRSLYTLRPESPCVDAGDSSAIPAGIETDLDGMPRFRDGDGDGRPVPDMGAYEYQGP